LRLHIRFRAFCRREHYAAALQPPLVSSLLPSPRYAADILRIMAFAPPPALLLSAMRHAIRLKDIHMPYIAAMIFLLSELMLPLIRRAVSCRRRRHQSHIAAKALSSH